MNITTAITLLQILPLIAPVAMVVVAVLKIRSLS